MGFTPTATGLLLLPGAIFAIGGLLITARLLQKGIPSVVMITLGMFLFILFTWQMSRLNLAAGSGDFYLPLIWRAVGIAMITGPCPRQSNALSFTDAYLLLGTIFFAGLPLLLLSSGKKGKKPQIAVADH